MQEPDGKIPDAGEFCPAEPYFFFKIRTGAQIEIVFELPHRLIGGVGEFSVRELLKFQAPEKPQTPILTCVAHRVWSFDVFRAWMLHAFPCPTNNRLSTTNFAVQKKSKEKS